MSLGWTLESRCDPHASMGCVQLTEHILAILGEQGIRRIRLSRAREGRRTEEGAGGITVIWLHRRISCLSGGRSRPGGWVGQEQVHQYQTYASLLTRMHSSRMHTVRSSSRLPRGCLPGQEVCPGGCLPGPGGACLGRGAVCLRRGVSAPVQAGICLPRGMSAQCMLGYNPPVNRMTDRQV